MKGVKKTFWVSGLLGCGGAAWSILTEAPKSLTLSLLTLGGLSLSLLQPKPEVAEAREDRQLGDPIKLLEFLEKASSPSGLFKKRALAKLIAGIREGLITPNGRCLNMSPEQVFLLAAEKRCMVPLAIFEEGLGAQLERSRWNTDVENETVRAIRIAVLGELLGEFMTVQTLRDYSWPRRDMGKWVLENAKNSPVAKISRAASIIEISSPDLRLGTQLLETIGSAADEVYEILTTLLRDDQKSGEVCNEGRIQERLLSAQALAES